MVFGKVKSGRLVTPHAGVWIKIRYSRRLSSYPFVTPHAGVWIDLEAELYELSLDASEKFE